jgi:hypothetical protein
MSNELAVIDAANPLAYLGVGEGEALKPVRLSLVQPINASAEEGTIAGRWRDEQSNFQFEDLNLVVLEMRPGRVMFESEELGSKPLCRSENGVMPVISDDLQRQDYNKGCAKCPMSQWKKIAGRNIKPPCKETSTMLAAQLETGFTYRLNGKGVSVPVFKDLKETIRKFYLATKAKGRAILPTQLFFKLSAVKVQGKKGTYFIPKFGAPTMIEDPAQQEYINNIHQRLVVNRGVDYTEAEEVDAQVDADPIETVLQGEYVSA